MKPDKKQLPQLIVLGVLVLVCVGYVSFKAMAPATPAPQAVKPAKEAADPTASVVPDKSAAMALASLGATPARRDPFMPQALPAAERDESQNVTPPTKGRTASVTPTNGGKLPRINVGAFNPFAQSGGHASVTTLPPRTVPEPTYTLTGVVRGEENVVVVRSSDNTRHSVRQGQLIDGRYRVLAVTDDGAVLANGKRRIYMKLGGSKNER